MVCVSRSTVNGAAPFTAITRCSNASASSGASTTGSKAVLQAVLAIDVGEALRHDHADVVGEHPPHRRLARGAGAEILPGHQDAGVAELRLVEHEVRILAAVVALRARMNRSFL